MFNNLYKITDPNKEFNYFENKIKKLCNKVFPLKEQLNLSLKPLAKALHI